MATLGFSNTAPDLYEHDIPATENFYSVEIRVDKAEFMYQFKIWKTSTAPIFVLVKQESDIINWLHPGDVFPMTYYSNNTGRPKQHRLPTQILNINRQDDGRFRGHYVVTLGIVEN